MRPAAGVVVVTLLAAGGAAAGAPAADAAEPAGPGGAYADVGDIRMYYERAGSGPPLVMLHGGFGNSERFAAAAPELAKRFTVIRPDSRGRGRSTPGSGPTTPGRLAHDVIGLLDALRIDRAHFVGQSEGAGVVLELLIDYPDRVRSAFLTGAVARTPAVDDPRRAGMLDEARALVDGGDPAARQLQADYRRLSPEPDRWPEVARRLASSWAQMPAFGPASLGHISRPVLVVKAHRDRYTTPQEFDALAAAIPGARVHDVGDATHAVWAERGPELVRVLAAFAGEH